jgi:hypothetical protein
MDAKVDRSCAARRAGARLPLQTYHGTKHTHKVGALFVKVRAYKAILAIANVFIDFNTLVVRDGIDPQLAHKQFLLIDEYRERVSPEIESGSF